MQVLGAVHEVERRQQHLPGQDPVRLESVLPHAHEAVLAHGRHGLQDGRVRRPLLAPVERGPAGGDGAGGDDHDRCGPPARAATISPQSRATVSSVTEDDPTLTTAITFPRPR